MKLFLKITSSGYDLMKMDAGEDIALNLSHDNLENPSNYVSEYAYNLKVPICPENNKLFTEFVHLDSIINVGSYDPTNYLPYVLTDNGGLIISTGRAYIKSISDGYYNLALTGSLSHIFQKLLNSGYRTDTGDSTYTVLTDWLKKGKVAATFIDSANHISRKHVLASWLIDSPTFDLDTIMSDVSLLTTYNITDPNVTETGAFIASIIGFAPTAQGYLPEFSNDKWLEGGTLSGALITTPSILPVLCSERNAANEPINPPDVGDGCIEAQMGEYRSYYQQPFIYINKLWQLYQRQFAAITDGYTLVLDNRWFNSSNPKVANLVYMLPKLFDNAAVSQGTPETIADATASNSFPRIDGQQSDQVFTVADLNDWVEVDSATVETNTAGNLIRYNYTLDARQYVSAIAGGNFFVSYIYGSNENYMVARVRLKDSNNDVMAEKKYVFVPVPDDGKYSLSDIAGTTVLSDAALRGYQIVEVPFHPGSSMTVRKEINDTIAAINTRAATGNTLASTSVELEVAVSYYNINTPFGGYGADDAKYYAYGQVSGTPWTHTIQASLSDITATICVAPRTGKPLSLESLFRDESPFSILLKHSKLMHLVWVVDDRDRKVTVMTSEDFYYDIMDTGDGVIDITKFVDKSKGIEVVPLSWSERKVAFNYDDTDMDYIGDYKEKYGLTYGSKILTTQNKLQSEVKQLLCNNENDTIAPSALLSETIYPASQILSGEVSAVYAENLPMPLNVTNGESANAHGGFYYRLANGVPSPLISAGWRNDSNGDYVYITDDSDNETALNEFCWHGPLINTITYAGTYAKCHDLPLFDTTSRDGALSLHFASVRERFTDYHNEPTKYLYDEVWKDYLEEAYNVQNKTVILYAYISRTLFDKLRYDPLVQIGNVAYLLTMIEGWGEHTNLCKLTLRQISNINKLTGQ